MESVWIRSLGIPRKAFSRENRRINAFVALSCGFSRLHVDSIVRMSENTTSFRRRNRPRITVASVGFSSFVLLQSILSAAFGIAVFAACSVFVLLVDHMGLLDTINRLLGSTMANFSVAKLIGLSAVFATALAIIRILFEVVVILVMNSSLMMIGGVPLNVHPNDELKAVLAGNADNEDGIARDGADGSADDAAKPVHWIAASGAVKPNAVDASIDGNADNPRRANADDAEETRVISNASDDGGMRTAQSHVILSRLHGNAMREDRNGGALKS